jgi:hypothetical protein
LAIYAFFLAISAFFFFLAISTFYFFLAIYAFFLAIRCPTTTGWLRIQSTGGARTVLISILVREKTQCLGAVREVCVIYQ